MSNAQDLLSILNGARSSTAARPSASTSNSNPTEKSILNFKAGKMNTTLQPNGKYLVEPDTRRGELHVVWTQQSSASSSGGSSSTSTSGGTNNNNNNGTLKIEWRDRRTKTVVNTIGPIFGSDHATFERVETGKEGNRVYLLTVGNENRHFFWMQDKNAEPDEELCVKVNLYMSDNSEAASAAGTTSAAAADSSGGATSGGAGANGMDNAELLRMMQGALGSQEGGTLGTVPGNGTVPTAGAGQIDALGNILETLGMPQPNGTPAGENDAGRSGSTAGVGGGLTLSDLQGAMAGLATASPPGGGAAAATAGPPLTELASSDIIDESGILDDKDTVERLIALLPEGQRTEEMLRENIRSPQVAQCLQRLTSALAEDAGSFNSIIANFQLNPADGMSAMARGNPIEAFLNCLLKDVEKKEGVKKAKTDDDKDKANDDGEGKGNDGGGDDGKEEGGSGDGDVKMDES